MMEEIEIERENSVSLHELLERLKTHENPETRGMGANMSVFKVTFRGTQDEAEEILIDFLDSVVINKISPSNEFVKFLVKQKSSRSIH